MTLRDLISVFRGTVSIIVDGYYRLKSDPKQSRYFSFYTMYDKERTDKAWEEIIMFCPDRLDYEVGSMYTSNDVLYVTVRSYMDVDEFPEEEKTYTEVHKPIAMTQHKEN